MHRAPVVVATDLSVHAAEALRFALRFRPASIHLVHAVDPSFADAYRLSPLEAIDAFQDGTLAAPALTALRLFAERAGDVALAAISAKNPAQGVVEYARDLEASLVFVGTHGRTGARRFVLGSVAEAIVRDASCPVLVVPLDSRRPWSESRTRTVLCAVSGAPSAEIVADATASIAHQLGAEPMSLLHSVDESPIARLREVADGPVERVAVESVHTALVARHGPVFSARGDAADAILRRAETLKADLIGVGTGQRRGPARALGSVAARVLRRAPCPVLVIPTRSRAP